METYTGAQTTLRDYLKVIFRHKVMIRNKKRGQPLTKDILTG